MVFSSHIFIFWFLPLALAVYYVLPHRGKHLALTLLSYVFYGWVNPKFVFLMLFSTLIDYIAGLVQAHNGFKGWRTPITDPLPPDTPRTRTQKLAVLVSIVSNLSLLGFFKYFNFALGNYNWLMQALGLDHLVWHTALRVALPLGISFYTFQSMSYSIDVYRGQAKAMRNFLDFACYVSMFPQLVAGPIIRFAEVADQLAHRTYTLDKFARGVAMFSLGMAKKVMIANACGKVADTVFNAGSVCTGDAWWGLLAYSFQIYFDFSGYSDMAIGLGLMLGFVFPKNFDMPYKSQSITEFWRRWHLSLSSWLRDYLYIPLGGNRKGTVRTYVNLFLVMFLGGLWHGASWNFVIWGSIHGVMLALERARGKSSFYERWPKAVRTALTFAIATLAWVFFRAATLPAAVTFFKTLAGLQPAQASAGLVGGLVYKPWYVIAMAAAALLTWGWSDTWYWTQKLPAWKVALCLVLLVLALAMLATQAYNPFIYFIF